MTRILRLFNKDVHHLWPQIIAFLAMLAAYSVTDTTYTELRFPHDPFTRVVFLLLPLSCWFLVISLVHEDPLPGSEQYWLTRPINWPTLLTAKLLFLAIFVNLPIFVYQTGVLAAFGFAPLHYLHILLWKQVFFSALLILPVASLAAVTRTLWQAIVAFAVILFVYSLSVRAQDYWGNLRWIQESAIAAVALTGSCVVILVQYASRQTGLSRGLLAGFAFLAALVGSASPWGPAYLLQTSLSAQKLSNDAVQISFDAARKDQHPRESSFDPHLSRLVLPIRLDAVPPGTTVASDWTAVDIDLGGDRRTLGKWSPSGGIFEGRPGQTWLMAFFPKDQAEQFKRGPVELTVYADVTLWIPVKSARPSDLWGLDVPGFGICRPLQTDPHCLTPFHDFDYAPFPISPWFGPLERTTLTLNSENESVSLKKPVAHLQRSFKVTLDHLENYLAR